MSERVASDRSQSVRVAACAVDRAGRARVLVLSLWIVASCGGSSASSPGGTSGNDAGSGTGGSTGSGGSGAVGTGGTVAGSGGAGGAATGTAMANLGLACASDTDCGGNGLTCLLPTAKSMYGAGGPANGYCTFACAANTDATRCGAAGGSCIDFSPVTTQIQAFCMQSCVIGTAGSLNMEKCHTRQDVACTQVQAAGAGVVEIDACIPTCSRDIDCPTGRQCDDAVAVCFDTKSAGDPLGTHCDATAMTTSCAGGCLPIGDGTTVSASFCTRLCVFGSLAACDYSGATMSLATGGPHGICALGTQDADLGDQGFCVQQCDVAADCSDKTDPGAVCDMTLSTVGIAHGICSWPGTAAATDGGRGG